MSIFYLNLDWGIYRLKNMLDWRHEKRTQSYVRANSACDDKLCKWSESLLANNLDFAGFMDSVYETGRILSICASAHVSELSESFLYTHSVNRGSYMSVHFI